MESTKYNLHNKNQQNFTERNEFKNNMDTSDSQNDLLVSLVLHFLYHP